MVWHMDIRDLRKKNLRKIIDTRYGGVIANVSKKYPKVSPARLSQLLSDNPKAKNYRRLGPDGARQLERDMGLQPEELDRDEREPTQLESRVSALPVGLQKQLLDHLAVLELAHRELPFAFSAPVDGANLAAFHKYLDDLTEQLHRKPPTPPKPKPERKKQ